MKIGIFDSGMGGLIIMKAIVKKLPEYDYVYLGDTKRLPYGNRSQESIYKFTKEAVRFLFEQNCKLIIIACNTVSAAALRRVQQEYLPKHYSGRRVLGMIIPTLENSGQYKTINRIGILGTVATVASNSFPKEIKKINPSTKVFQQAAPLLVPLIENGDLKRIGPVVEKYTGPLLKKKVNAIVLGCTHYAFIKRKLRKKVGSKVKVISQDEIIPQKLEAYLKRHPEIDTRLSKKNKRNFFVTNITPLMNKLALQWFGKNIKLKKVNI